MIWDDIIFVLGLLLILLNLIWFRSVSSAGPHKRETGPLTALVSVSSPAIPAVVVRL